MSLKEKIEGNELDLCLNQLEEVPVKELVACSKATHLDVSCNYLKTLPGDFATLTHLVKIDLSKNSLTELPPNFGNLINLQILDLYQNQLTSLPVSFCRLKHLTWLDLNKNPLDAKLQAIAGDCLDEKQCQLCAKKIVAYMQTIDSNLEREKEKKLKEVREKEAIEREKINKELEEQRRIKKMEKERRKAESKAKREEKLDIEKSQNISNENISKQAKIVNKETIKTTGRTGWLTILLYFLLGCLTVYFYFLFQDPYFKRNTLPKIQSIFMEYLGKIHDVVSKFLIEAIPYVNNLKSSFLRIVHSAMLSVSKLASNLELFLSIYF